jgi:hypothetical protein
LKIEEGNFTDELANTIKKRKSLVVNKLINKLSSDTDDEECLNASSVLNELIDINWYFSIINRPNAIERLSQIAFDSAALIASSK